jgi:hypothetical protein
MIWKYALDSTGSEQGPFLDLHEHSDNLLGSIEAADFLTGNFLQEINWFHTHGTDIIHPVWATMILRYKHTL